jgi:hypothetical protein
MEPGVEMASGMMKGFKRQESPLPRRLRPGFRKRKQAVEKK